jgi:hypothetical protein
VSRLLNHTLRQTRRLLKSENPILPEKAALEIVRGLGPEHKQELREELADQIAAIDPRYVDQPQFQNIGLALALSFRVMPFVIDLTDEAGDEQVADNAVSDDRHGLLPRPLPDLMDRRLRVTSSTLDRTASTSG